MTPRTISFAALGFFLLSLSPLPSGAQPYCPDATPIDSCPYSDPAGDTTGGPTNLVGEYSCYELYSYEGPEATYLLQLAADSLVTATVDSTFDAGLALLPAGGGDCDPATCIAGADNLFEPGVESLTEQLPAGDYYLVVDGYAPADYGAYSLTVDCEQCTDADGDGYGAYDADSCPSGNDCCDSGDEAGVLGCSVANAASIHPGAADICQDGVDQDCNGHDETCADTCAGATAVACGQQTNGSTVGGSDVNPGYSCLGWAMPGQEAYHELTLDQETTVTVTVTPDAAQPWDPALVVLPGFGTYCDSNSCAAGSDDGQLGESETVTVTLVAGTYFLVIDAYDATEFGDYELGVICHDCVDADGDGFQGFLAMSCPGGADCCDTGDEASAGCNLATAPLIYPGAVDFCGDGIDHDCDGRDCCSDTDGDGFAAAGCGGLDCCDVGDEASPGCTEANRAQINPAAAEVCGNGVDENCDGTAVDPCPDCSASQIVDCASGPGSVADTAAGTAVIDDYCGAGDGSWTGPEYIFSFTPATDGATSFSIGYTPYGSGGYAFDLFLLPELGVDGVCDQTSCLDSSTSGGSGAEEVVFFARQGETYYLAVDERTGQTGAFDYELACSQEQCQSDGPLNCGDSLDGDSAGQTDDVSVYPDLGYQLAAPEVVYTFSPESDVQLDLTLSFGAGIDLALIAIEAQGGVCSPGGLLAISDDDQTQGAPPVEQLSLTARGGMAYYLVVDGWQAGDAGSFTLSADCPNSCQPSELLCAGRECVDPATDPLHCGGCGVMCGAAEICCGGSCTDTATDPAHCGGCGLACALAHVAVHTCSAGSCGVDSCEPMYGDCDGQAANGCETYVHNDHDHCGDCATTCDPAQVCSQGSCQATCAAGETDCGGDCVDTDTNPDHCGSCGNGCDLPNVGQTGCAGGQCTIESCQAGFADCNGLPDDGCEVSIQTDPAHCGACGNACSLPNVTVPGCQAGSCTVVECAAGYSDCDNTATNGCEVATGSDPVNCGACGNVCNLTAVAEHGCQQGSCTIVACEVDAADCNGMAGDGCEILPDQDPLNCGACGNICDLTNVAEPGCQAGSCTVVTCASGFADCDATAANGCEVEIAADPANCGFCGQVCNLAHVDQNNCQDGTCRVGSCDAGFADCNQNASDGCEIETAVDVANCGACGAVCNLAHADQHDCVAGTCAVVSCEAGFTDCNGDPADGCEVATANDPTNCGACGQVCDLANVSQPGCQAGSCTIESCAAGYSDCDGDPANGCEINTGADPAHCGACGQVCDLAQVDPQTCQAGSCIVGGCTVGYADCDAAAANGCEIDTQTDPAHCGACGAECQLAHVTEAGCAAGDCTVIGCQADYADCDAEVANGCEVFLPTSHDHCGGCGNACAADEVCTGGSCGPDCPAEQVDCFGSCVDTDTDAAHCGGCGNACELTHVAEPGCQGGACTVVTCAAGYGDCDAEAANGCEQDLAGDPAHCGACGNTCDLAQVANHGCAGGSCTIVECQAGFGDCDNDPASGCEVDLETDSDHCGVCGSACDLTHVDQASCQAGACTIVFCEPGWADCDGEAANGCEIDLQSDAGHCGACDHDCAATGTLDVSCQAGSCRIDACVTGLGDCNRDAADGCETDLSADPTHCGSCGGSCVLPGVEEAGCADGACTIVACAADRADCNGDVFDGCEIDTLENHRHCGGCLNACPREQVCDGGTCTADCTAGTTNCAGACVDTASNPDHCGACFEACELPGVVESECIQSECAVGTCQAGLADCNQQAADGCETDVTGDVANCGGCGQICDLPHTADSNCAEGTCVPTDCEADWGDCNASPADGCEIQLNSSRDHCGGCGLACGPEQVCSAGVCAVECAPGETNCDGNCVDTDSNPMHCGGCFQACDLPQVAEHGCEQGDCAIVSCESGWADCNGQAADGCEVDTDTDPDNCGACGMVCDLEHAESADCQAGLCQVASCAAGWADCDGRADNGCEVDTTGDPDHCGACGNACAADELCVAAECCADADQDGFADDACGGTDCDDGAADIHPEAEEICGDGIDQDCNGSDLDCDCQDADGDGIEDAACGGDDCDDDDPNVYPGAVELCDGRDNDCDGQTDEGCDDGGGCGCHAASHPAGGLWLLLALLGLGMRRKRISS